MQQLFDQLVIYRSLYGHVNIPWHDKSYNFEGTKPRPPAILKLSRNLLRARKMFKRGEIPDKWLVRFGEIGLSFVYSPRNRNHSMEGRFVGDLLVNRGVEPLTWDRQITKKEKYRIDMIITGVAEVGGQMLFVVHNLEVNERGHGNYSLVGCTT